MAATGTATVVVVVFQGEKGAYSEAAAAELLGASTSEETILLLGEPTFNACYEDVESGRARYAMLPIENSIGGSIHANFDLQLRHKLFIVAEFEFRVRHCLMALPGAKIEDIKEVYSHPQALAQCDKYLRRRGLQAVAKFDTAGSAKQIHDENLVGVAAIASARAANHYGLQVLESGIEDDTNNFTRFILLASAPVSIPTSPSEIKYKASIVFTLVNSAGILFHALAAFSLRGIDLTKIESRPDTLHESGRFMGPLSGAFISNNDTSAAATAMVGTPGESFEKQLPEVSQEQQLSGSSDRFRFMFFVDCAYTPQLEFALRHLAEIAPYIRVLGCYPRDGVLTDHVAQAVNVQSGSAASSPRQSQSSSAAAAADARIATPVIPSPTPYPVMSIGIIGFGKFGQFLAKRFKQQHHRVVGTSRHDYSAVSRELGVEFYRDVTEMFEKVGDTLDALVLSMSILSFEEVLNKIPPQYFNGKLVVDVLSVKEFPRSVLLRYLPKEADILCTHPMFGPESGKHSWKGLPFVYERVRISEEQRCDDFLNIFRRAECNMVPMTCEAHDQAAANSQFITHFTGRMLAQLNLRPTGIDTKGFETLLKLVENTVSDSDDLFSALFLHNPKAVTEVSRLQNAMQTIVAQLSAKAKTFTPSALENSTPNAKTIGGKIRLSKAINRVAPSKTVKTHALAIELNRQGKDVMTTLTIGEPDYGPPKPILKAAADCLDDPLGTKYTSVQGTAEIRAAISEDLHRRKSVKYDPNGEILVSNGGKQAIYQIIQVLCEEGDEVVIPSPFWVSYPEIVQITGATPVIVRRDPNDGYLLTAETLRKAITPRTRMFIFCNPCNPTGAVHPRERLEELAAVLRDFPDVFILSDEIYERLVFDGAEHVSFASLPGMRDRTFIVSGFSKGYAMTGFRLGYVCGPAFVIGAATKLQGQLTSCPSSISQRAGVAALVNVTEDMLIPLYKGLEEKRDYLVDRLQRMEGVICNRPQGAFYLFPVMTKFFGAGVTDASGNQIKDSTDLCEYLIRMPKGIALVPGDAFGAPEGVRICYAASMEDLKEAADRIEAGLKAIMFT